jgi:hypothetical protein
VLFPSTDDQFDQVRIFVGLEETIYLIVGFEGMLL